MREEHWKPVKGYEGLYSVSDAGRVKTLEPKGRMLNQYPRLSQKQRAQNGGDYLGVSLRRDRHGSSKLVHILVLEAFAPARKPGEQACHGVGGDRDNRYPENLCWGTKQKNQGADKRRDGTAGGGGRKLTEDDVRDIHRLRMVEGWSVTDLAEKFSLTRGNVRHVLAGRTWRPIWLEFNA